MTCVVIVYVDQRKSSNAVTILDIRIFLIIHHYS